MKILKKGKLKEAKRVTYTDLEYEFPEHEEEIGDLYEDYEELSNFAYLKLLVHFDEHIDLTLNSCAASVLLGDDKYKTTLQNFNKEFQEEAKKVAEIAKKLEKYTNVAIKLFDKLSKED